MYKIGILGGTFDPVHFGHLRIGLECQEILSLDELRFIPCASPPHRAMPTATAEQRTEMLSIALQGVDKLCVDDRELHRPGHSYTVDTLKSLAEEFPQASLYLVVGSDSFQNIFTWHQWQKIFELANIIIAQRPDHVDDRLSDTGQKLKNRFCGIDDARQSSAGKIVCVGVSQLEISATNIRQLVKEKRSLKFLLPDRVIEYIEKHQLYRNSGKPNYE